MLNNNQLRIVERTVGLSRVDWRFESGPIWRPRQQVGREPDILYPRIASEKLLAALENTKNDGGSLGFSVGGNLGPYGSYRTNDFAVEVPSGSDTGRFAEGFASLPSDCIRSVGALNLQSNML